MTTEAKRPLPTEPENFRHDGIGYRVWQNDFRWWVASVDCGGEYHGATRKDVVECAIDEIDAMEADGE